MEDEKDKIIRLENELNDLKNKFDKMQKDYAKHQHDNIDGTNKLKKSQELDMSSSLKIGLLEQGTLPIISPGTTLEQIQYAFALSKSKETGAVNKLDGLQLNFLHQPNNTSKQSFMTGFRSPVVSPRPSQTISTTSGGNTITINGFNFTTNELAGALISIYNSSNVLVETRVIASNTSTQITISGTWGASTSNGLFQIYTPVYFGSADVIWQRFYTQEGTGGGIRFGMGATAGALNQNGLLYMNATGDLYWRNKSGTSTKLN